MTQETDAEIEKAVVEMWSEILDVPNVGTHDDFFELGGHSLLAGQILARVRRDFGVRLKLRDFFENATAAGVAARIRAASPPGGFDPGRRPDPQPGRADQR